MGDDGVPVGDHGREHAVAHLDPKVVQVACEVLALGLRVDVLHDAQEVARIDAVGQRLGSELRVEDRDPGEDGVEGMAGDGEAQMSLRVEQPEAREVRVELGDLLVGGLVGVEVDARASAAVGAGSMIGGASPDLHDDAVHGLVDQELGPRNDVVLSDSGVQDETSADSFVRRGDAVPPNGVSWRDLTHTENDADKSTEAVAE